MKDKVFIMTLGVFAVFATAYAFVSYRSDDAPPNGMPPNVPTETPSVGPSTIPESRDTESEHDDDSPETDAFVPPLAHAGERVTKKPFGIYVTETDSPVRPERFSGYHTGTDFEAFPEEADTDVTVSAICSGKLLAKRPADGYGGVAVGSCTYEGLPVTVVYGHLRLSSITSSVGDTIAAGDALGTLGTGYSTETDGERRHLHLGIHRGPTVDILGYVPSEDRLSGWIDPCTLICRP